MKRVAIYLRVSATRQDTENQRRELEAVAERSGWRVVKARLVTHNDVHFVVHSVQASDQAID